MRAGDWVYMCALLKYVCVYVRWAVRSAPSESRYEASMKRYPCFLYSFADALFTRRYPLYNVFISIRAAQCNGRFYNNHTACVSLLPLFPPVRIEFRFLYSSRSACAFLLHPSLPSTATPGTSSEGNSWWRWLMLLGLILGFCRPRPVKAERCITHFPLLHILSLGL